MRLWTKTARLLAVGSALALVFATGAEARIDQEMTDEFIRSHPEYFSASQPEQFSAEGVIKPPARPAAIPDIFGPGAVLTVGNVYMKVTNLGLFGNPFVTVSNDASAQWPGASGVEYLAFALFSVGAVNPVATEPNAVRRVSYFSEWRPPSLEPEDRMYEAYEGIVNGARLFNDDGDRDPATNPPLSLIDEDFLDGHDNDGDGRIDEDYAALGQQMITCAIRDDTPQAVNSVFNEKHIPFGLEVHQQAFAFANTRLANFNAVEYTIYNRSGHDLDSLTVGFRVDMDCGPLALTNYFNDDFDLSMVPSGEFVIALNEGDPRRQYPHFDVSPPVPADSALCPRVTYRVQGFTVADDNSDQGRTTGAATFLLLGHTTDPLATNAPTRVQFKAFRSYVAGTPYDEGGNPTIDQQRFEFMTGGDNVDQSTGLINQEPGQLIGDYQAWASVGPFRNVPNNGSIQVSIAYAVQRAEYLTLATYPTDYLLYQNGLLSGPDLLDKHPVVDNALTAQIAYEGVYEPPREGLEHLVPGGSSSFPFHGRETPLRARPNQLGVTGADCHDESEGAFRPITEFEFTWFDFDCDYCTGVYDSQTGRGYFLKRWNTESPPPSPAINVGSTFNFSDNPERTPILIAAGDNQVMLAWDNLSEITPDPERREFDFRSYRIWKAANWQRPIGSSGPTDDNWALLGEFRLFDHADSNFTVADTGAACPMIQVPEYLDPVTNTRGPRVVPICLVRGDLWNRQSGEILRPDRTIDCVRDTLGECKRENGIDPVTRLATTRTQYPIGRYRYLDREVKNGFTYFYSVTAGDSGRAGESFGRRAAQEADAVVPQSSTSSGKNVWVVPNPYRGFRNIAERPSAWDLTPNASDPTGTHVDFFGLPAGNWTIRIFTVSGDLVQELHSTDPVNDSVRGPITLDDGRVFPGFNRQQDQANDGQARWNLISRNGQDVVSGIYLFVVESTQGQQRGKFVIIR
ncbi:MAG TPA: hypothetical protein VEY91_09610 [Candidatus Limnocylindria bacterium]|nr:hypothetical protein [Candidatus Limnocylindria bacterium]